MKFVEKPFVDLRLEGSSQESHANVNCLNFAESANFISLTQRHFAFMYIIMTVVLVMCRC